MALLRRRLESLEAGAACPQATVSYCRLSATVAHDPKRTYPPEMISRTFVKGYFDQPDAYLRMVLHKGRLEPLGTALATASHVGIYYTLVLDLTLA